MSGLGNPDYFKNHRDPPRTARQIRRGVKVTAAQERLVEATLVELGLIPPEGVASKKAGTSKTTGKRKSTSGRAAPKRATRKAR